MIPRTGRPARPRRFGRIADRTSSPPASWLPVRPTRCAGRSQRRPARAAVNLLLAAERLSQELVRYNKRIREVITGLLRLRALAVHARVASAGSRARVI
jgi:hypothetical protein